MKHTVFNRETMEFRYGAGIYLYSERLENGRLIACEHQGSGMPVHPAERISPQRAVQAFELEIDGCDAGFGWEFADWSEGAAADGRNRAELTLCAPKRGLQLRVVTLCGDNGFMTRELHLKNLNARKIALSRTSPLAGTLWEQTDSVVEYLPDFEKTPYSVGSFRGREWGMEGMFDWTDVPCNTAIEFGSSIGRSGHGHPFAIAKNDILGGYFLCQLEWSANWKFRFYNEYNYRGGSTARDIRLHFSVGPDAPSPMRVIDQDEEIALPAVHFGLVWGNLDKLIISLHDYQRRYLLARPVGGYELVSYDGWGYHGSDYREDILFGEIDRAAEIGAEVYMVDAGWYGAPGTGWYNTVGDWETPRLPHDLYPIIDRVHERGMKFGLWVEPESAGSDSALAKAHPDWFMKAYGNTQPRALDLSNPEVEDWILNQLRSIVRRYRLDLLRLDFNTHNSVGFRENGDYEESVWWRYVEALHRIFDTVHTEFPGLILENCAGGGGRTDLGMMRRFSKTQISDWFKLPRAARTFNGMSLCLPPECLLMQYGRAIDAYRSGSAETQIQVSIMGVPKISGIAPIEEPVNPALLELLAKYIGLYKSFIRPIIAECAVYHHTPVIPGGAGKGWVVQEFISRDKTSGYALLVRMPEGEDSYTIRFRGLNPAKRYTLEYCSVGYSFAADGADLMRNGVTVTLESSLTSELILIRGI